MVSIRQGKVFMELRLPIDVGAPYKSASQRARVLTETWALENMYCPACPSDQLEKTRTNAEAVDFICTRCEAPFQLKSSASGFGRRVVDAAHEAMMRAIRDDRLPHLLLLHYAMEAASVVDLLLVPKSSISPSAIQARRPLSSTARRAGWVGCNILLDLVPPEGKITLVADGKIASEHSVRESFRTVERLSSIAAPERGWTLDVLTAVRSLQVETFALQDAYSFEETLAAMHPENRHIRPKIRQQLQVLRNLGYLEFVERGLYRWLRHE
jgi:type II restriction enzyme